MDLIGKLLDRFKGLANKDLNLKQDIIRAIKEKIGFDIVSSQIYIHNGVIYVRAESVLKSEIYLHKRDLLETLRASGHTQIVDLR